MVQQWVKLRQRDWAKETRLGREKPSESETGKVRE
jgi:hypothetical protein